jgi:hypothetical protein
MKKRLIYFCIGVFVCYWIFNCYHAVKAVNSEFKGILQKVVPTPYGSGYHKTITVNNQDYDLTWVRWYDDLYTIEVGDSVVKEKGVQEMILIKKK